MVKLREFCRGCETLVQHCPCDRPSAQEHYFRVGEPGEGFIDWDRWVGTVEQVPTMLIKHLFHWRGYRIDLHCFLQADPPDCFHTHPAKAIRVVLWGGYVEEIFEPEGLPKNWAYFRDCAPSFLGLVMPSLAHRVHRLLNGKVSYSLWLRGPVTHKIKLVGSGWPKDARPYNEDLEARKDLA